jgi:hypothetical protein
MPNIYYSPEKFGLKVVAELEYSDMNYVFDTLVVWADENGVLYSARDAGCSCPTPFEDYGSIAELDRVHYSSLRDEVQASRGDGNPDFDRDRRVFLLDVKNFTGWDTNPCADCRQPALLGDYLCKACREA